MTFRFKTGTIAVALFLASIHAVSSSANTIDLRPFIVNASFEVPTTSCCNFPTSWFQGGSATSPPGPDAGNWTPADFQSAGLIALDGSQVGYINNYDGQVGFANYWFLAQTLPLILNPGDEYRLTYAVARRADAPDAGAFRVQINGNVSAACPFCYSIAAGSTGAFAPGTWNYFTVSYTAQAQDVGTSPTIYLVNDGRVAGPGLAQVEFDLAVPDGGSTAVLLGSVLFAFGVLCRKFSNS